MRRFLSWLITISLSITLSGCTADDSRGRAEVRPSNPALVSDEEYRQVLSAQPQVLPAIEGRVVSGVLTHHLVAGALITEFMSAIARQKPALIVLVGANHPGQGPRIITGFNHWQTPAGVLETDEAVVKALLESGLAVRDEEILAHEHSVSSLMPFIKHFIPGAKVVPVILHRNVSLEELDELLEVLAPCLKDKGILLASVDFSHYLSIPEAENKDSLTLAYMEQFNYQALLCLGNDHLDSPASLVMALRYAENSGIKEFEVLRHTNSGIILKNSLIETTSYFTLVCTE